MQSESRESLLNANLKAIIALFFAVIVTLVLFKNLFFNQLSFLRVLENYLDPEIA